MERQLQLLLVFWLVCVFAQFCNICLGIGLRNEFEAIYQSSVEQALGVRLVKCGCPLEYGKRTFVFQDTYNVCEGVCLGSGISSNSRYRELRLTK
jgi:hypothetical protein